METDVTVVTIFLDQLGEVLFELAFGALTFLTLYILILFFRLVYLSILPSKK